MALLTLQFYTPANYKRALQFAAVMTAVSHLHPSFQSVQFLHGINEPLMDSSQTPGLQQCASTIFAASY